MRRSLGVAAVCLLGAVLVVVLPGTATPQPVSCTVLEVTGRTLLARSLPADTATVAGRLHETVNAIGAAGPVAYGLTAAGHVVRFDRSGQDRDLGPVRAFPPIVAATAGTVVGDRWYVRAGALLFAIDVDAASADYLHVLATVPLHPLLLAIDLDDFDVDPASGAVFGVAQPVIGQDVVVRIDLAHGTIIPIQVSAPAGAGYGSASFGPDGALYVRQDDSHGRSIRYRIRLSPGSPATELSSGPALTSADATGCLPAPPPPPPPPRTTTRRPPPPPRPTTTNRPPRPTVPTRPPTTTATAPAPHRPTAPLPPPPTSAVVPPPAPPSPPSSPPPSPPSSPPPPVDDTQQNVAASTAPTFTVRKQQRQFGLSVLIIIIGGGAAAARMRRGRRSSP